MKIFLAAILFLCLGSNVCADDRIFLYGKYYSGMTYKEFLKTGPAQCDEYPDGQKICNRQKVDFASSEWTQFFEFKGNDLTCVAFGAPLSMTAINFAMTWLQDEGYIPINAEAGGKSISFSILYDNYGKSKFEKEAENFNKDLPSSDSFISYLIKNSLLNEDKTMDKLPNDSLVVTLGGSKSQGAIFVCFEQAANFAH